MNNLATIINEPLTNRDVFVFDSELERLHLPIDHKVQSIPKGYTIMDLLSYVFEEDITSIAFMLQNYADGEKTIVDFINGMSAHIKEDSMCIKCAKRVWTNNG